MDNETTLEIKEHEKLDAFKKAFELIDESLEVALKYEAAIGEKYRRLVIERLVDLAVCASEAVRKLQEADVPELRTSAARRVRWPIVVYGTKDHGKTVSKRIEDIGLGSDLPVSIEQAPTKLNRCLLSYIEYVYALKARPYPDANISWDEIRILRLDDFDLLRDSEEMVSSELVDNLPFVNEYGRRFKNLPELSSNTLGQWVDELVGWGGLLPLKKGAALTSTGTFVGSLPSEPEGESVTDYTTFSDPVVQGKTVSRCQKAINRAKKSAADTCNKVREDDLNGIKETKRLQKLDKTIKEVDLISKEESAFREVAQERIRDWIESKWN